LGNDTSTFLSLGLTNPDGSNPGFAVFAFLLPFPERVARLWEVTPGCSGTVGALTCSNEPELVQVLVGNVFDFSRPQIAANRDAAFAEIMANFISIGSYGNKETQVPGGGPFPTNTGLDLTWSYLVLIDRSGALVGASNVDGYDVAVVRVSAVPVPASAPLLAAATLSLAGLFRRRRKAG
jgi:hypothetical protein